MIRLFFLILMSCLYLFSCKESRNDKPTHEVVIADVLTVSLPNKMSFVKGKGIDSYVAYFINEKSDSFIIQYGKKGIVNSFYYVSPPVFPLSQKQSIINNVGKEPTTDEVVFSEYPEEDREQKIFDKNYFMYDTINGIVAKIVQPKKVGDGIVGIYMPKLKNGKSLSIYGRNLDSTSQQEALRLFETIKYK